MKKATAKVESKSISVLRNLIDEMDTVTHSFEEGNTNISWDGEIKLYKNSNIDDKCNLSSILKVQIKGRTRKIPKGNNINFLISKDDLENYLLVNGTLYFVIIFNKNNDFKIYYIDLLPYNLRELLKETPNKDNKIKVKLKYIQNDPLPFEKMLRNFAINMEHQKKISDKVFQKKNMMISINNKKSKLEFYDWKHKDYSITSLLGEEKYLYELDENDNIINIELATLNMIKEPFNIEIKDKLGNLFFKKIDCIYTKDSTVINIGKSFKIYQYEKNFKIKIKGTLNERINSLRFLIQVIKFKGFYINNEWIKLNGTISSFDSFNSQLALYNKILNFINNHNINKDINLDDWDYKDINNFIVWIKAIDENIPIKIKNFTSSVIGSIKIHDICFSIFAEYKDDGSIKVNSIWNSNTNNKYLFIMSNTENTEKFETTNIFDFLNKDTYLSDDINFSEMKKYYNENELQQDEEYVINMQALEAILAYDENKNKNLLDYANFLLDKIINKKNMNEVAIINKYQIKKRLKKLTFDDKYKLMKILEKKNNELFYNISINLLLDKKDEAKKQFEKLTELEKKEYLKYPISIFFN